MIVKARRLVVPLVWKIDENDFLSEINSVEELILGGTDSM
jgi:hypothetical protein